MLTLIAPAFVFLVVAGFSAEVTGALAAERGEGDPGRARAGGQGEVGGRGSYGGV